MNRTHLGGLTIAVVALTAAILGVAFWTQSGQLPPCSSSGKVHQVVVSSGAFYPRHVTAMRCERLHITNASAVTREIGFGPHDHHQPYDGVAQRVLRPHESFTITLIQAGTFSYHDHFHDEVTGSFTVR